MRERCKIDGREIHATVKNKPRFESQVTEHTVEGAADVVDHSRPKLVPLMLEGVCSDLDDNAFANGTDAQSMHIFLTDLRNNPRPVKIETPRTIYDSMLLKVYEPEAASKYANALHFTSEWLEYNTVGTQTQTITVQKSVVKKGAQQNAAQQKPTPQSFATSGTDAAGVTSQNTPFAVPGSNGVVIQNPAGGVTK